MKLDEELKAIAKENNANSFISHFPDGATLIYIGASEQDVTGQLLLALIEIARRREDKRDGFSEHLSAFNAGTNCGHTGE